MATYLCPGCDGWGLVSVDHLPSCDPDHEEHTCAICDETGVVRVARELADGLQPWTGDKGRQLQRMRPRHTDPLVRLAQVRAKATRPDSAARVYDYPAAKHNALRRTLGMAQHRMVEAAIRLDVAVREMLTDYRSAA